MSILMSLILYASVFYQTPTKTMQPPSTNFTQNSLKTTQPSNITSDPGVPVLFTHGNRDEDLPKCGRYAVCNKVDKYNSPWIEKQCQCPSSSCSSSLDASDGHTITDRNRLFKTCEPTKELPKCRFFRDITWTVTTSPDNVTEQVMHCHCPKSSVAYLVKRQMFNTPQGVGYQFSFACSPESRILCRRKEPCRLFTVRKRHEVDDVNLNTLCQCPTNHHCPKHHWETGVIAAKSLAEETYRTYSGFCVSS
ncbi:protein giant-lens isoform X1 [Cloeon dipterum]|uniref:protein giant-lens isoform X1 n=1 Tax=Cloeon dipterum TaxID=197152 RepID=UPI00321FA191